MYTIRYSVAFVLSGKTDLPTLITETLANNQHPFCLNHVWYMFLLAVAFHFVKCNRLFFLCQGLWSVFWDVSKCSQESSLCHTLSRVPLWCASCKVPAGQACFVIPDWSPQLRWFPFNPSPIQASPISSTTLGKFLARNLVVLPSQNACGEFLH